MSGSPVFLEGKLVGAVAYSYPFAKETIAGITPIGEMIEATRLATPRAASARFAPRLGADGPSQPLDREAVVAALQRAVRAAPELLAARALLGYALARAGRQREALKSLTELRQLAVIRQRRDDRVVGS